MQSPYLYYHIANSNPDAAADLCSRYGYNCSNIDDIVNSIVNITNQHGEPALQQVMDLHPDKELILEFNQAKNPTCDKCPILNKMKDVQFLGANGAVNTGAGPAAPAAQKDNMQHLFSTIENNKMMVFLSCLTLVAVTIIITQSKK